MFASIVVVTLLAYARTFDAPFQFDDYGHIVGNPIIDAPSVASVFEFARARVIPFATLVMNHRVGGEDPFGYHVVNIAVHLIATFALFQLALALCRTPRLRGTFLAEQPLAFAGAAAFVFACHPIQIQAVTYIVQRMSSMAAMFYLGSVLLYVRARNAGLALGPGSAAASYAGSALMAIGAFLSKENAASLPLAVLLAEIVFYPADRIARRVLRLAPFALLVLSIPLLWKLFGRRPGPQLPSDAPLAQQTQDLMSMLVFRASRGTDISPFEYLLTQALVLPRYLALVVLPSGFNVDHDVPVATGLSPPVLLGFAFLAALFVCGLYAVRRAPALGFGVLWLFVTLSIESSVLPIRDVMVEHRMYLPMAGVALAAGWGFALAVRRWRLPALIGGAVVVALLAALTFARNEVWRSQESLWRDAVAKSPNKPRPYANLGTALHHLGRLDEAASYYCKALRIDPKGAVAKANLGSLQEERVEKMAEEGNDLVAVIGADGVPHFELPDPCASRGEPD